MSIEVNGAYSPNTVYGQLTMPFLEKPVHINSHTPDEEYGDDVLTKSKFYNNMSDMAVNIEDIQNINGLKLDDKLKVDIGIKVAEEFPPKPNVEVFQSSTYNDGTGVVFDALKNGYTAGNAIKVARAFNSYQNSMNFLNGNPIDALSERTYEVGKTTAQNFMYQQI